MVLFLFLRVVDRRASASVAPMSLRFRAALLGRRVPLAGPAIERAPLIG
jgi:hypothetical protein